VIGMSAWFRPEKDHQLLIDAYLAISAQAPDARLAFVGGGPLLEHYKKWVTERGLDDRIKFVGPVDDVRGALRAFDVACLVPRSNEGFSNSVLEKMATGLPVIVTDVGGNKEAVVNFQNGYVIAPGARAELERHLLTLHRDPALRARLAAGSRARVESLFSLQQMIDRHESLYNALAQNGSGVAA
jgi:glycosyltransferase involved in cell wall biosynthesis